MHRSIRLASSIIALPYEMKRPCRGRRGSIFRCAGGGLWRSPLRPILFLLMLGTAADCRAEFLLAEKGATAFVIVVDPAATASEGSAAKELASTLRQITGAEFLVQTNTKAPSRAILVGSGEAARRVFGDAPLDALGAEELIIKTKGTRLLLAGGRPRGTLYAVSLFLQQQCDVRWWTPWASRIPKQGTLR